MAKPDRIYLYRITHIDNLDFILESGKLTSPSHNDSDPNYTGIGDSTLIGSRNSKQISVNLMEILRIMLHSILEQDRQCFTQFKKDSTELYKEIHRKSFTLLLLLRMLQKMDVSMYSQTDMAII